jgi:hypothetical protein
MWAYFTERDGLALPAVIIVVIFLIIIGMGTLELGTMDMREAIKAQNQVKAFYLAEAGGERALQIIKTEEDWQEDPFWNATHALGDGEFVVTYTYSEDDNSAIVTSEGIVQDQTEKVKLKITFPSGGGAFSNGVFGTDQLRLTGSSQIWGYDSGTGETVDDLQLAGSFSLIKLTGMSTIYGAAGTPEEDDIEIPRWRELDDAVTGGWQENPEDELPPVEIPSDLSNMSYTEEGNPGLGGNYRIHNDSYSVQRWPFEASISGGIYRFKDFSISADAQVQIEGHVRMYVEDDFDVTGNSDINLSEGAVLELYLGEDSTFDVAGSSTINEGGTPSNVAIYSASDREIHLSGDVQVYGAIYAPEADFQLSGSSPLWGGVVAREVRLDGNVRVYYDVALMEDVVPGDPGWGGGASQFTVDWTKGEGWRAYFE